MVHGMLFVYSRETLEESHVTRRNRQYMRLELYACNLFSVRMNRKNKRHAGIQSRCKLMMADSILKGQSEPIIRIYNLQSTSFGNFLSRKISGIVWNLLFIAELRHSFCGYDIDTHGNIHKFMGIKTDLRLPLLQVRYDIPCLITNI